MYLFIIQFDHSYLYICIFSCSLIPFDFCYFLFFFLLRQVFIFECWRNLCAETEPGDVFRPFLSLILLHVIIGCVTRKLLYIHVKLNGQETTICNKMSIIIKLTYTVEKGDRWNDFEEMLLLLSFLRVPKCLI